MGQAQRKQEEFASIETPDIALIDCDLLTYEMAYGTDEDGKPLGWPIVRSRVDKRLEEIAANVGATEWTGYLTGSDNFRKQVATIRPYKGNRNQPKPFHYWNIRNYLLTKPNIVLAELCEADDLLSIKQRELNQSSKRSVICSRDKDLRMVPGLHYSWASGSQQERLLWLQDEVEGFRWFCTQLLTGDATDNIPGLYGIGLVKAQNLLKWCNTEQEMYYKCKDYYLRYFGSYWQMFLDENAKLLWMLRTEDDDITKDFRQFDEQEEEWRKQREQQFNSESNLREVVD